MERFNSPHRKGIAKHEVQGSAPLFQVLRAITSFLFGFVLLLSPFHRTQAGTLRLSLLASAETQTDSILLSNLLPAEAGSSIRSLAEKISLGAAPRVGSIRILSRSAVSSAIGGAGLHLDSFLIPEQITVSRSGQTLSRDQLLTAIQSSSSASSYPGIARLDSSDLQFDASIIVPSSGTTLSVTQIAFDPFISSLRIRIQPITTPASLPFYVTAHIAATDIRTPVPATAASSHSPSLNPALTSPILVQPGQSARLHLHSRDFDTVVDVRSLQRGHLGELVRVRLAGTGKTLLAHVVGQGSLDELL